MKVVEKRTIAVLLSVMVLGSVWNGGTSVEAAGKMKAEQGRHKANKQVCRETQEDVIGMGEIQISAFDMATSTYALARSTTANGNVEGSGVRLRKLPKSNATVLELMYNKETVRINYTKSSTVASGNWYYVKRIKTGTWGWVNYKYLLHWD